MNNKKLVLCDKEEEYARHMSDFLKSHKESPWEIHTYTKVDELLQFAGKEDIEMLVVAENVYDQVIRNLKVPGTILLNESGLMKWENVRQVDKYQQAENVWREILCLYMEIAGTQLPRLNVKSNTGVIGMYSPVRRCLQTSFALTLGQMLARKHKTLYLNFEHYPGITELLPDLQTRDLADLIYFLTSDKDKFLLRLQTILRKKGELDYVPPMKAGQNLITVTAMEWQSLLQKVVELGGYEFVVLDLSENMQGLFDILRMCRRVFTLTKEDGAAQSKITQYEQLLQLYEYQDVLDRTSKLMLPMFRKLPDSIDQFTKGELADYVDKVISDMLKL